LVEAFRPLPWAPTPNKAFHATLFVAHSRFFCTICASWWQLGAAAYPQSRNALFEIGVPAPLSPAVRVHGFRRSRSRLRIAFVPVRNQLTRAPIALVHRARAPCPVRRGCPLSPSTSGNRSRTGVLCERITRGPGNERSFTGAARRCIRCSARWFAGGDAVTAMTCASIL
jgi:hypothetical protein